MAGCLLAYLHVGPEACPVPVSRPMRIAIRRLSLEQERSALIQFLRRYLTPHSAEHRFAWLYLENPNGNAQVWVAEDSTSGELVGASAVFPKRLHLDGKETLGFVFGDFCIHPGYRSLGPAVQLQRACLEQMSLEIRTIGYDFPGAGMLPVHRRLGRQPEDRLVRLAKPLRVDRKISEKVPRGGIARTLSAVGNGVLGWSDRWRSVPARAEIAWHQGRCGEEFSALAAKTAPRTGITTARTATYLNWRYLDHPIRHFDILTARRDGVLMACAVVTRDAEDACIVDLFGMEEREVLTGLLCHAVESLRSLDIVTVSAHLLASHPWLRLFARLGFVQRDSSPVIFYRAGGGGGFAGKAPAPGWFLMDGDRES